MSSPASVPVLRFEPRPSRHLIRLVWLFHLATIAIVLTLPLTVAWQTVVLLLLIMSLLYQHRRLNRGVELALNSAGEWEWREEGKAPVAIDILPDSYVMPWLVLISYRVMGTGRRHAIAFLRDSLPAGQLRQLRVALRQHRTPEDQTVGR